MRLVLFLLLAGSLAAPGAAAAPGRPAVMKKSTWRPDYPPDALRKGQEGRVSYALTVDEQGRATSCVVTASSGHSALDEATCRTARKTLFEPALDATGSPTTSRYEGSEVYALR